MQDALIDQANTALRAGDESRAVGLLHDAVKHGEHPQALNALGMVALRHRDPMAIDWFQRAAAADPQAAPLWMNLASAHRQAGDDAAERAALEAALALDQRHLMANVRLAELHDRAARPIEAAKRWQGVVTLIDGAAEATPDLAILRARAADYVAAHTAVVAAKLDEELAPARAGADPTARRRFDACVDGMLGRRRVYRNECHGIYYPFLPADEFFERAAFPWLDALEAAHGTIRDELTALLAARPGALKPYVEMEAGTPGNIWSQLDHSLDWGAIYLWRYGARQDEICDACPETARLLDAAPLARIPGRGPNAFFSIIRPGARLPAHTGVSNVRAIIHLPLIVPPGCGFRVGGETREWEPGKAFAFDDTIEHEAWNESDEPRAILILDAWNPHLSADEQRLLHALFAATAEDEALGGASATAD